MQAWIYEYFPMFSRTQNPNWSGNQPRAVRWAGVDSRSQHSSRDNVIGYRKQLDQLRAEDVLWTPFCAPRQIPGASYYHGCLRMMDSYEAYMPDRVARQFGRVQGIPRGLIPLLTGSKLERKPDQYKKIYGASNFTWDSRPQHSYIAQELGAAATQAYSVTADYLDWYRLRSHVRVHNPGHGEVRDTNTTDFQNYQQRLGPIRQQAEVLAQQAAQDEGIPPNFRQGLEDISRWAGTGGYPGINQAQTQDWWGDDYRRPPQHFTQEQPQSWFGYPGFQQNQDPTNSDDE